MALEKQQTLVNDHPTRGAANPAPLFAFRTMRAKAHAAVSLNREEALRYLGYSGQVIDGELVARLESMAATCEKGLNPAFTWRVFAIDEQRCRWDENPCVALEGTSLSFEGTLQPA